MNEFFSVAGFWPARMAVVAPMLQALALLAAIVLAGCGDRRPIGAGPIVAAPPGYYDLCARQAQDFACIAARP